MLHNHKKFIHDFIQLDKKSQINTIKELIKLSSFCEEYKEDISIEKYSQELEEADKEIENGNFILHEDVLKILATLK